MGSPHVLRCDVALLKDENVLPLHLSRGLERTSRKEYPKRQQGMSTSTVQGTIVGYSNLWEQRKKRLLILVFVSSLLLSLHFVHPPTPFLFEFAQIGISFLSLSLLFPLWPTVEPLLQVPFASFIPLSPLLHRILESFSR